MTDGQGPVSTTTVFEWHPDYAGRSVADVRSSLEADIARDQRSYALAMEGAEQSEGASLTAIVELERRWSLYDFDWTEMDAGVLADRIVRFQQAREERQELFPFAEYRIGGGAIEAAPPPSATTGRNLPIMKIGAVILVLLIVVFLLAVLL